MSGCSNCGKWDTEKCQECNGFGKKNYGGFSSQTCAGCGGSGKVCRNCKKGTGK
jgi:hypothetical protein